MNERLLAVAVSCSKTSLSVLAAVLVIAVSGSAHRPEMAATAKTDEPRGWLVIEGGSYPVNPVVVERFRELIGGADAKVLLVPTAMADSQLTPELNASAAKDLGLRNYEIFSTHDRRRADREEFAGRIRRARGATADHAATSIE